MFGLFFWRRRARLRPGPPLLTVPRGRTWDTGKRRRVGAFLMDAHPVTNADWERYIQATGARRPQWMTRPGHDAPEQPVVGVTYAEATAYARWVGKRLPTEREWVRAARGDDRRPFPWGDTEPCAATAHFGRGARGKAAITGPDARAPGRGPFGHTDLCGNVWEWCQGGGLRGGFWGSKAPSIDSRLADRPDRVSGGIGFRCVR